MAIQRLEKDYNISEMQAEKYESEDFEAYLENTRRKTNGVEPEILAYFNS